MPNKAKGKSSAQYYKSNPASKAKKDAYNTKFEKKKDQVKKRSELVGAERKKGIYGKMTKMGKDMAHTKSGLKLKSVAKNRGSKSDMPGDKRSRGGKSCGCKH